MSMFPAPPIRTIFPDQGAQQLFSRPWVQWFQAITNYFNSPIIVTGSRGGNQALANLLIALNDKGIIKDNTVA